MNDSSNDGYTLAEFFNTITEVDFDEWASSCGGPDQQITREEFCSFVSSTDPMFRKNAESIFKRLNPQRSSKTIRLGDLKQAMTWFRLAVRLSDSSDANSSISSESSLSPSSKLTYPAVKQFVRNVMRMESKGWLDLFGPNKYLSLDNLRQVVLSRTNMSEDQITSLLQTLDPTDSGVVALEPFLSGMHWLQRGLANASDQASVTFYSPRLYYRAVVSSKSKSFEKDAFEFVSKIDDRGIELLRNKLISRARLESSESSFEGVSSVAVVSTYVLTEVLRHSQPSLDAEQVSALLKLLELNNASIHGIDVHEFLKRIKWIKSGLSSMGASSSAQKALFQAERDNEYESEFESSSEYTALSERANPGHLIESEPSTCFTLMKAIRNLDESQLKILETLSSVHPSARDSVIPVSCCAQIFFSSLNYVPQGEEKNFLRVLDYEHQNPIFSHISAKDFVDSIRFLHRVVVAIYSIATKQSLQGLNQGYDIIIKRLIPFRLEPLINTFAFRLESMRDCTKVDICNLLRACKVTAEPVIDEIFQLFRNEETRTLPMNAFLFKLKILTGFQYLMTSRDDILDQYSIEQDELSNHQSNLHSPTSNPPTLSDESIESQLARCKKELAEKQSLIMRYRLQQLLFDDIEAEHDKMERDWESNTSKLQQYIRQLESRYSTLEDENDSLWENILELEKKLKEMSKWKVDIENKTGTRSTDDVVRADLVVSLKDQVKELSIKNQSHQSRIQSVEEDLHLKNFEVNELKKDLEIKNQEIKLLSDRIGNYETNMYISKAVTTPYRHAIHTPTVFSSPSRSLNDSAHSSAGLTPGTRTNIDLMSSANCTMDKELEWGELKEKLESDVIRLKQEIEIRAQELECTNNLLEHERMIKLDLQLSLENINSINDSLRMALSTKDEELASLNLRHEEASASMEVVERKVRDQGGVIEGLNQKIEELLKQIYDLENLPRLMDMSPVAVRECEVELELAYHELNRVEGEFFDTLSPPEHAILKSNRVSCYIYRSRYILQSVATLLDQKNKSFKILSETEKILRQNIERAEKNMETLKEKYRKKSQELVKSQSECSQLKSLVSSNEIIIQNAAIVNQQYSLKLADLQRNCSNLEKELEKVKLISSEKDARLNNAMQEIEQKTVAISNFTRLENERSCTIRTDACTSPSRSFIGLKVCAGTMTDSLTEEELPIETTANEAYAYESTLIQRLESKTQDLEAHIQELNSQLAGADERVRSSTRQNEERSHLLHQSQIENENLSSQIQEMHNILKIEKERSQFTQHRFSDALKELQKIAEENQKLKVQLEAKNNDIDELSSQGREFSRQLSEMMDSDADKGKQLNKLENEYNQLKRTLLHETITKDDLQGQLDDINSKFENLHEEHLVLLKKHRFLQIALEAVEKHKEMSVKDKIVENMWTDTSLCIEPEDVSIDGQSMSDMCCVLQKYISELKDTCITMVASGEHVLLRSQGKVDEERILELINKASLENWKKRIENPKKPLQKDTRAHLRTEESNNVVSLDASSTQTPRVSVRVKKCSTPKSKLCTFSPIKKSPGSSRSSTGSRSSSGQRIRKPKARHEILFESSHEKKTPLLLDSKVKQDDFQKENQHNQVETPELDKSVQSSATPVDSHSSPSASLRVRAIKFISPLKQSKYTSPIKTVAEKNILHGSLDGFIGVPIISQGKHNKKSPQAFGLHQPTEEINRVVSFSLCDKSVNTSPIDLLGNVRRLIGTLPVVLKEFKRSFNEIFEEYCAAVSQVVQTKESIVSALKIVGQTPQNGVFVTKLVHEHHILQESIQRIASELDETESEKARLDNAMAQLQTIINQDTCSVICNHTNQDQPVDGSSFASRKEVVSACLICKTQEGQQKSIIQGRINARKELHRMILLRQNAHSKCIELQIKLLGMKMCVQDKVVEYKPAVTCVNREGHVHDGQSLENTSAITDRLQSLKPILDKMAVLLHSTKFQSLVDMLLDLQETPTNMSGYEKESNLGTDQSATSTIPSCDGMKSSSSPKSSTAESNNHDIISYSASYSEVNTPRSSNQDDNPVTPFQQAQSGTGSSNPMQSQSKTDETHEQPLTNSRALSYEEQTQRRVTIDESKTQRTPPVSTNQMEATQQKGTKKSPTKKTNGSTPVKITINRHTPRRNTAFNHSLNRVRFTATPQKSSTTPPLLSTSTSTYTSTTTASTTNTYTTTHAVSIHLNAFAQAAPRRVVQSTARYVPVRQRLIGTHVFVMNDALYFSLARLLQLEHMNQYLCEVIRSCVDNQHRLSQCVKMEQMERMRLSSENNRLENQLVHFSRRENMRRFGRS